MNRGERQLLALRYILQRRAVAVAIGVEADISSWAEFDDLVENGPAADIMGSVGSTILARSVLVQIDRAEKTKANRLLVEMN